MDVIVVGGGIGGLTLALALHASGAARRIRVYEAAAEMRALGVGINLGAHAMKELSTLGLEDALVATSCQPQDYAFFTRHGQLVYREPFGKAAGHQWPHISLLRPDLQRVLLGAVRERIGPENFVTAHRCTGVEQNGDRVTAHFADPDGKALPPQQGDVLIACDGIHSAVRTQFYPDEGPFKFRGYNLWRGVTRTKPYLTGASIARIGARHSTLIIYPLRNNYDGEGNQLINWVAEIERPVAVPVDWNKPGRLEDFFPTYQDWTFDWMDVPALMRGAEQILSYPMVDRDPLPRWSFGRVTLLGDAAHPMYPQGGNGGAQAILDAAILARLLKSGPDPVAALKTYEDARLPVTSRIVVQNRTAPPNVIVDTVEQRTGGKRFDRLDDVITQDEMKAIFESYQKVAGYHVQQVSRPQGQRKMADTAPSVRLTFDGAQNMLGAAIAKAKEMNVPQCICVVDAGGHLLAMARMDGAFALSIDTALRKAQTAAAYGVPTGDIAAGIDIKLAIATEGRRINLPGGLPVIVDGHVAGGIGVGSGTGEQDRQVAAAALGAIAGTKRFNF